MKKRARLYLCVMLCFVFLIVPFGCGDDDDNDSPTLPGNVLADQDVTVGAGGGSADVTFSGSSGQVARITLTASNTAMEPYGYLTYPNGAGVDTPPNGAAQNGVNSADLTLTQTGTYTLTVFDGTNQGGAVHVKVEVL